MGGKQSKKQHSKRKHIDFKSVGSAGIYLWGDISDRSAEISHGLVFLKNTSPTKIYQLECAKATVDAKQNVLQLDIAMHNAARDTKINALQDSSGIVNSHALCKNPIFRLPVIEFLAEKLGDQIESFPVDKKYSYMYRTREVVGEPSCSRISALISLTAILKILVCLYGTPTSQTQPVGLGLFDRHIWVADGRHR
jgi:hypothetical protein